MDLLTDSRSADFEVAGEFFKSRSESVGVCDERGEANHTAVCC